MRRQIILFSLCVLAGIAFLLEMKYFNNRDAEYTKRILAEAAEYEKAVTPLKVEKTELENERLALVDQRNAAGANLGSVLILCAEPSRGVMDEIYPKMQGYLYGGLIAVSDEFFPGTGEKMMSIDEVNILTSHGWELVLSANSTTDIEALYTRCEVAGLARPTAVYFPLSDCSNDQENAIRHLGLGSEILFTGTDTPSVLRDGMFVVYAHGSYETNSRTLLTENITSSGAIALVVSYEDIRGQYVASNFNAMLQIIDGYYYDEAVAVTGVPSARERMITRDNRINATVSQCDARIAEIDTRLEEINAAIDVIEKK